MRKRFIFPINEHVYEKVTGTIRDTLTSKEKDRKCITRIVLAAEDVLKKLLDNQADGAKNVTLLIIRFMGSIRVTLSCPGQEFELFSNRDIGWDDVEVEDELGEKSRKTLREILIDSYSKNLQYRHSKSVNTVVIRGKENEYRMVYMTGICLLCGILFGFAMKFLMGDAFSAGVQEYFLNPMRTMFLNALKILVGPVVFFSMVCCISSCGNLSDIGKIGVKVLAMYLLTTVIAVCLGFGLFHLFPVGDPSLLEKSGGVLGEAMNAEEMGEMTEAIEAAEGGVSVIDTIVNIIPDNVMTPFRENNLLQLIFLGIFLGAGISVLQDKQPQLETFFSRFRDLFMTLLEMLCKLIPLAVFCNMACLVYATGTDVLLSIMSYVLLCTGAILCMLGVYLVLIFLFTGLNPFIFAKRYVKVMLTALSLSSSTAALPQSMETCRKMGISNRIVSFSLPLGSSINMDGSSLVMSIICMFMARVYGVEITPALLFTVLISIILLSLGAPSMAGADLAIVVVLLNQIGIPASAIALIMGIDTLLDMMQAMCNTTSDAAVALIVAKRSGELNTKMYV